MDLEQAISLYDQTREICHKFMRENPDVLGGEKWLRYAIQERDIQLGWSANHLICSGYAFSSQTQQSEWFEFIVPLEVVYTAAGS